MAYFIPIQDMELYKDSRSLSKLAWTIYSELHWKHQRTIGDQFIRATDSVGANFTEGYYRYHFLEKVKFCYIARGSLGEAMEYWLELLDERGLVANEVVQEYRRIGKSINLKLNGYIRSLHNTRNNQKK